MWRFLGRREWGRSLCGWFLAGESKEGACAGDFWQERVGKEPVRLT